MAGGRPDPRRLLAGSLRPAARGSAGGRPGRAGLGGLEPRVPAARLAQPRRLAGDVRGRGRRHRPPGQARRAARHRRVVAIGHSAGGHLALWAAARRGLPAGRRAPSRASGWRARWPRPASSTCARPPGSGCRAARREPARRPARQAAAALRPRLADRAPPARACRSCSCTARRTTSCPSASRAATPERAAGGGRSLRARRAARAWATWSISIRQPRPGGGDRWLEDAVIDRADAERLDAADPLAPFRERFVLGDPTTIYLDGNSLGRLPLATRERLASWSTSGARELVGGWHEWIDLPGADRRPPRDRRARRAAGRGDRLRLHHGQPLQARRGGARHPPGRDRHRRGELPHRPLRARRPGPPARPRAAHLRGRPVDGPQPEDVERACAGADVALVVLSHVAYRSGALADIERINRAAAPAPVLWDLSPLGGRGPVELERRGVELAVGCTYKYLNAGPGAPGLPVRARGAPGRSAHPDPGLVRPARPVPDGASLRPRARRPRLPRGHPADPRAGGGRGGREARRRGGDRPAARQGGGAHGADRRAARRAPRPAGLSSSEARATRPAAAPT